MRYNKTLREVCFVIFLVPLAAFELKPLTEDTCKDPGELIKGESYNGFVTNSISENKVEGETRSLECCETEFVNCSVLLRAALKNVSIVRQSDGQITAPLSTISPHKTPDSGEALCVTIKFKLNYTAHNSQKLRCESLYEGIKISSYSIDMDKISRLVTMAMTPSTQTVIIGSTYNITCSMSSGSDIADMEWLRSAAFGGLRTKYDCEKEWECTKYEIPEETKEILSIKTRKNETDHKVSWKYYCGPASDHVKGDQAEATVILKKKETWPYITAGAALAILIAILVIIVVRIKIKRRETLKSLKVTKARMELGTITNNYDSANIGMGGDEDFAEVIERIAENHAPWNCSRELIMVKKIIGEGNFGEVMLGTMPNEMNIVQHVAIKTIKQQTANTAAILEFEKEINMMASVCHKNIVNLLGICIDCWPFYIIMEYMENGPLNNFLYLHAPSLDTNASEFTLQQLVYICQQPCSALEYLASKNMLHRDVSARNCLVGENLVVKLADFGLSRDTSDNAKHYYKSEGGMVPVKWMAPEALTYGKYTTANDVWAYGVLMWEIFSYGANPYAARSNQQVMTYIANGGRLDRPDSCPEHLWNTVITKCWIDNPDDRILFSAILAFLAEYNTTTTTL